MTLSQELAGEYGHGFSCTELTRMVRLAGAFYDEAIEVTLSQHLSWLHVHALLPPGR